jgi:hypothetical protein
MPRESSDARAALMTVYMSQRSSLFNSPKPSTASKKPKAAERPPDRKLHEKDLAMTTVLMKNINKSLPYRRRSDAELGQGLACTGRTIYGVGEASRGIRRQRRNSGLPNGLTSSRGPRTSQGRWAREQLTLIERGKEMVRRDEEARRHMQAVREREKQEQLEASWKKANHAWVHLDKIGDNLKMVVGGMGWAGDSIVGAEEVAHADRYFDMYINVEACGGH